MGLSKRYTNLEKTAIVILALGAEAGADILRRLPKSEAARVAQTLAAMRAVPAADAAEIVREFQATVMQGLQSPTLAGGADVAGALVRRAFTGQTAEDLTAAIGQSSRLTALEGVDGAAIARALRSEQPQTIALVLAHAEPSAAAAAVKALPQPLQLEVLLRIANLEPVDPEVIAELDEHLRKEFASQARLAVSRVGGPAQAAKILQAMGKDGAGSLLDEVEARSPERADEIRALLFTFDDLVRVPRTGMIDLNRQVGDLWQTALRGASPAVAEHVYGSMSERAGRMLRDDLETGGKTKVSDVHAARQKILAILQKLVDEGKIEIPGNDDEFV